MTVLPFLSYSCLRPKYLLPLLLQQITSHLDTSKPCCPNCINWKHYIGQALFWRTTCYFICVKPPQTTAFSHSSLLPLLFFSLLLLSSVDLSTLLPKAGVGTGASVDSDLGAIVDVPSAEDLGQSLVFTNSHHNGRTATHSYAHATANSYAHAAAASATSAHPALVQTDTLLLCIYTLTYDISVFSSYFASVISTVLSLGHWFWVPECI